MGCRAMSQGKDGQRDDHRGQPDAPGGVVQTQADQRHHGDAQAEAQSQAFYAIQVVLLGK